MNLVPGKWTPEFRKRVLTAVFGGGGVLALIFLGGTLGTFLFITAVSLAMVFEFSQMTFSLPDQLEKRYILLTASWFVAVMNYLVPQSELHFVTLGFLVLFSYFLWSAQRYQDLDFQLHFKELAMSVFGILYLVILPAYFYRIRDNSNGARWVFLFLFIVWAGDSCAYLIGTRYGKRKLYPQISPKKSVEGALAGLLGGVVVAGLYKILVFHELSLVGALLTALFVGVVSQVGDLCESFFKRVVGRKDSGSLLPGHGGVLDRFDSIIFSAPVMYACVRAFGT